MEARRQNFAVQAARLSIFVLSVAGAAAASRAQILTPAASPLPVTQIPAAPQAAVSPQAVTPQVAAVSPNGVQQAAAVRHAAVNPGSRTGGRPPAGQRSVAQSPNFIVFANQPQWAEQVAQVAEQLRRDLAIYWLGRELPAWPQRCPLHVNDAENLGAGGETRFALNRGVPGNWMMSVQGTRQRILDSVLPHEITHTLFATHFGVTGKYVPRWADEGAATTVENEAEKRKHRHFLQQFLKTGRGLAFNEMFRLKEYPHDILPLYAQGHSAVQFLLDQAGPRHFIHFLEMGMQTENWPASLQQHYAYPSIGDFQVSWNRWLIDGSPSDLTAYSPLLRSQNPSPEASPNPTPAQLAGETPAQLAGDTAQLAGDTALPAGKRAGDTPAQLAGDTAQLAGDTAQRLTGQLAGDTPAQKSTGDTALLAGNTQAAGVATRLDAPQATTRTASWYQQQLHQTSGAPATDIPPHNHFAGDSAMAPGTRAVIPLVPMSNGLASSPSHSNTIPLDTTSPNAIVVSGNTTGVSGNQPPPVSIARPQPIGTPGIQVLQWGGPNPRYSGPPADPQLQPWLR